MPLLGKAYAVSHRVKSKHDVLTDKACMRDVKASYKTSFRVRNVSKTNSRGSNKYPERPSKTTDRSHEPSHPLNCPIMCIELEQVNVNPKTYSLKDRLWRVAQTRANTLQQYNCGGSVVQWRSLAASRVKPAPSSMSLRRYAW